MTDTNVQLVRRGFEAITRGDLEPIRELLDPDVKWHGGDPSAEGACRNRDEALTFVDRAVRRAPLGKLVDVIDAGDKVVVIMQPPPEDGEQPGLVANLTTFRDGKVVEMVHYPDPADALVAAGIAPRSGQK
jgi:ketosteroid isomerase-like protein